MLTRVYIIILLLLVISVLHAQELPLSTQQQMENVAELSEVDMEDDALLQQLVAFKKKPLNLNEAMADDLQIFQFLSALQIQNFVAYRAALGDLISIYELQSIPAWDLATIRKLLPFITVHQPVNFSKSLFARMKGGDHYALFRASRILEKSRGFDTSTTNHYLGDRNYLLMRYQYKFSNLLQYGVTAEKDAGEQIFKGAQSKGFDFYSAHLFVRNMGMFKAIALGDFSVNLGQGLVQWQSLAFTKGAEIAAIKRQAPVLKPYASAGEANFNRGAGATIRNGKIEATLFASIRNIDANIVSDTTYDEAASSLLTSGLHRTSSEMDDKGRVSQTSLGGNFSWKNKGFQMGVNAVYHSFSVPLEKRDEPYNLFALKGDKAMNMSMDYSYTYKNLHFFGEAAVDKNLHQAFLNGILASVDSRVDVAVLHRYYAKDYTTVYGKSFSENTRPVNESGIYFGLRIRATDFLTFSAYGDYYKFPWLKYRVDAPSTGREYLFQINYRPNKQIEAYTYYKNERKPLNDANDGTALNVVTPKLRQHWRIHFSYALNKKFTWQNRIDALWYDKGGSDEEKGFLIFTGATYKPVQRFSVTGRLLFFKTTGFNSRIYAYENDVLYSFSTPFYSGKGFRYYFLMNYDATKHISLWLKASQTVFGNQQTNGSGTNEIDENTRSEIRLQAMVRF